MLTKTIAVILSLLTTLMIAGCTQEVPVKETEPSQISETLATEEESAQICRGKLVVNGRDITEDHEIKIYQPNGNAHIPLLAVAEALGARTHWRDAKVAVIEVDGGVYEIDTAEEWFGILIPPGAENAIREVADSEMIIDIYSLRGLLKNLLHAEISIDYSEAVIYIDTKPPVVLS